MRDIRPKGAKKAKRLTEAAKRELNLQKPTFIYILKKLPGKGSFNLIYYALLLGQQLFELVSIEIQIELTIHGNGYITGFLGNYNCNSIGDFGNTHC